MTTTELPVGSHPAALEFPHFPTRQQAFVWRNWGLVPVARLARVLRAETAEVEALARGLGLPVPPEVAPEWLARGYCTLLRANWHLLPYEQLLELLDWDAERLAFVLREEDALWIKLGALKPKCEPIHYQSPTAAEAHQTALVCARVQEHFPDLASAPAHPPFAFLKDFDRSAQHTEVLPDRPASGFDLTFIYSYSAPYGDCLLHPELDPYPDGLLERLAARGITGVWLPVWLYTLMPWEPDPAQSVGWETRQENLRRLAARIQAHGLGLFLYINEPRGVPAASRTFELHPEWRGITYPEWGVTSLCTSQPAVLDWVRQGTARLFRDVPGLAGVFTISMSEFPTHCYSAGRGHECPRCVARPPAEIVADVNRAVAEGVWSVKPEARVIVWTWGWHPAWELDAVDRLPAGVDLMAVSEWGLPLREGPDAPILVDYSMSRVGPSDRSRALWRHATARGLHTVAKVQLNCTWELSNVPWIPVPDLVARHLNNLRTEGVTGLMLSWTVGGYPGGNLDLLGQTPAALAVSAFGAAAASAVSAAWQTFATAFEQFPFSCSVIYNAPHNCGPANLLHATPTGYRSTMVQGMPYDDLRGWRDFYSEDEFEARLQRLSDGWREGLALLAQADPAGGNLAQQAALRELRCIAEAAYCHFRSTSNQVRFVRRRAESATGSRQALRELLHDEISLAKRLHACMCSDSRIGFEAANHYAYTRNDLMEKVLNCEWLLEQRAAADSTAPVTVVAFGDSITAAATDLGDAARWPVLLQTDLLKQVAPRQVRVINAGVGGNTSREGLARLDTDVLAQRPDLVLVEFGGNDATPERNRHVHLVEFSANLLAMKTKLDALGGCRMVLMTFPPVVDHTHTWRELFKPIGGQDAFVEPYRRVTRMFAREHGLPLFDLDAVIRANPAEFILPDGVHLTAAGNRAVAAALTPFLTELLSCRA